MKTYGEWRRTVVWFQHRKFINMGTDVTRVRFAEAKPVRLAPLAPEPPQSSLSAQIAAICRGDGRGKDRGVLC